MYNIIIFIIIVILVVKRILTIARLSSSHVKTMGCVWTGTTLIVVSVYHLGKEKIVQSSKILVCYSLLALMLLDVNETQLKV